MVHLEGGARVGLRAGSASLGVTLEDPTGAVCVESRSLLVDCVSQGSERFLAIRKAHRHQAPANSRLFGSLPVGCTTCLVVAAA